MRGVFFFFVVVVVCVCAAKSTYRYTYMRKLDRYRVAAVRKEKAQIKGAGHSNVKPKVTRKL